MSQNAFDQKKQHILSEIQSDSLDLSPKGTIDELCWPIMNLINSHADMVTTSSCSGRLSVFVEGQKLHNEVLKSGGKGEGGKWLFVSHNQNEVRNWIQRLSEPIHWVSEPDNSQLDPTSRLILYKFEPFILHVKCRSFHIASQLFNTAMSCGFRESGIGSNNIVAVRINIKLDVPIGYLDQETRELRFFVSPAYIKLIDEMTLAKYNENARKMQELLKKIDSQVITISEQGSVDKQPAESKEERRQRKRREGLLRQQQAS
ncbi:LADA_0C09538g1_1 [Lachancea dasiensis]|uniref:tRNA wybutosine-synthesizing protein 3 n=1 Tax=Lachancea dasiensis TaxID=1072105 RepID=A0A1G4J0H6_9SACH|nr:LADA_0C09538g1_1 [Lachancea dasiensis]